MQFAVFSIQCAVFSVQCVEFNVHCSVFSLQFVKFCVRCAISSVQCVECNRQISSQLCVGEDESSVKLCLCLPPDTEGGLHCNALQVHCTVLHCTACTALHCTALHCTARHSTALHCTGCSIRMRRQEAPAGLFFPPQAEFSRYSERSLATLYCQV